MAEQEIVALLRQAPFSFVGTVERLGAATMTDLAVDARTAIVHVDQVLHAPEAFAGIAGQRITLQLAADAPPPAVGESAAFFAQGLAFGESIAVSEVGRLPVDAVQSHVTQAREAGRPGAFAALQGQVESERLRAHVDPSAVVVIGRVIKLEDVLTPSFSEHDPDWWRATLDVYHVEQGDVQPGQLAVLYPNSLDVRWRTAPKPKASQGGLWILHATAGALREAAPYQILHPEDYQPVQQLDTLRGNGTNGR